MSTRVADPYSIGIESQIGSGALEPGLGQFDHIVEQYGDGHGAYPPWDGADVARDGGYSVEVHIADGLPVALVIDDAVDADIDHEGPLTHHVGGDEARDPGRGDEHIRASAEFLHPLGVLVAADHGCFPLHEQDRNRASDHCGSSDDDAAFALEIDPCLVDELERGQGGAGGPHGAPVDHISDVCGVHAFDILVGVDQLLDVVGIDSLGHGHVHHDRVDFVIGVELVEVILDDLLIGAHWECVELVVDADGLAGACLILRVDAGTVVARFHEQRIELGCETVLAQCFGPLSDLLAEPLCQCLAVDDLCAHALDHSPLRCARRLRID